MPKTQTEEDKKHGDKLESLVDRASGTSPGKADERLDDDDAALGEDDEDDSEDGEDEDVENDDDK